MRLDHIAFRTIDREGAVEFYVKAFGYKPQVEFEINLEDGSKAKCMALEPTEKTVGNMQFFCTSYINVGPGVPHHQVQYHLAPEIFISDGPPGSLIHKWVMEWGHGSGGVHHFAYQVDSVRDTMKYWIEQGLAEFTTPDPLSCEDLTQVFSKPNKYTGVIYEFIERKGQHGFCRDNVGRLMASTANLKPGA